MQNRLPDLLIVALLLALPLVCFFPVTLGGQTMLPADNLFAFEPWAAHAAEFGIAHPHNALINDLILQHYPWRLHINRALAEGELPLWNPYLFAGTPFLGGGLHGALYPFSVIFIVLPLPAAYGWFTVSQLFLAGLMMYLLVRGLGVARGGGAAAAVVYQLCGFMLTRAVFPSVVAAAAWLPLVLLMAEYIIRQQKALGRPATMPWIAVGAAALAMVVLAGHPEMLMYTVVIVAYYGIARLVGMAWRARGIPEGAARALAALAAMGALGVALGGVQLAPMVEAVQGSFREGAASLAQVQSWALPWRRLVTLLVPNFFGSPSHHSYYDVFLGATMPAGTIDWGLKNYVEGGIYLGILTLVLALVGAAAHWAERLAPLTYRHLPPHEQTAARYTFVEYAGPYIRIFLLLAALALTFVFGLPTYALIYYGLPGASQLHTPFRWIWPFSLSAAVLAAFGVEAVRQMWLARSEAPELTRREWGRGNTPGEPTWRVLRWCEWVLFGAGSLLAAALVFSRLLFDSIKPAVERVLHSLLRADTAFTDARMFYSYEFRQFFILAVFLLGAGVVMRLARGTARAPLALWSVPAWQPAAVAVLAVDLLAATWAFYPANDPALLAFTPPVVEDFLAGQPGEWRLTTFEAPGANTFSANSPWFYRLEDVRGYESIIQKQYTRYMALIYPQSQLEYNRVAPIFNDQAHALDSPLLDLLGVRYIVSETRIGSPRFEPVYVDDSVWVYENPGAMPRAFTLPIEAAVCLEDDAAFGEAAQVFDVRQFAILAPDPEDSTEACWPARPREAWAPGEAAPAAVTEYSTNTVMVDVITDTPAYLILADSHYPGWRAFVRPQGAGEDAEQALEIERVNGNFRAVRLDAPGAWTVRFRYTPDSVKLGGFASFLSLVALVFGAAVWLWRVFYRPEREAGDATGMVTMARNSLAPIVIQLFNKGIDFVFAFIMLRILEPEGAGKYYYAIVIFGWFDILTNFGLNTLLTRDVARDRDQANRYLYNSSLLRLALAMLGVPLLAGFLGARQAAPGLDPLANDTLWAIVLLYIGLIPNSLSTGLTALFYAYEKAEYPAAIATVATMLKATLGIIVLALGFGVVGLAGASIATNLVTLIILASLARRFFFRARIQPDGALRGRMLRESWPLMLSHLLQTLFFKVDVTLLEALRGNETVGRYSTAYKWLDTLNVVPAFLTMGIFPALSRQAREDRPALARSYRLAVKLLVVLALPVAVATTFLADVLVLVLGGSAYLPDGAVALRIMIWSIPIGWINSVTNYVLIALDRQRALMRAFMVGVGFNLLTNLAFIPTYGYRAAAVITIFSELVLLVAVYLHLRPLLGDVPWVLMLWRPAAAAALMGAAVVMLWPMSAPLALIIGIAVYAGALWLLNPLTAEERAQLAPLLHHNPGTNR